MPNEIKHIKSKSAKLTGPNAARQQGPSRDSKPSKKAGDGALTFMVWSMAGTVIAACSKPIFSDVADLTGGGGGDSGSSSSGPSNRGYANDGPARGARFFIDDDGSGTYTARDTDLGVTNDAGYVELDSLPEGTVVFVDANGAVDTATGKTLSGIWRSLPYNGSGDLLVSPLTNLLALRLEATPAAVGGEDAFYQEILDSIFGAESGVTVSNILDPDNYNPLVEDNTVTQLVSRAAIGLTEIGAPTNAADSAGTLTEVQALFATYRTNIENDPEDDDVVLSGDRTVADEVTRLVANAESRPVVAIPDDREAISMTEGEDFVLMRANSDAESLFGFEDPLGNDVDGQPGGAREPGQLVGIYIEAASADGNINVMFGNAEDGAVPLALMQDTERGVVANAPAMMIVDGVSFYYVSADRIDRLILRPADENFNTDPDNPDTNPQIRFYVYDGEDTTVDNGGSLDRVGSLEIEVAAVNDVPVVTPPTDPALITSNADNRSGTFQVSDADDGDTVFTWSATGPTTYGTIDFADTNGTDMSANGAWTFTLNQSAFDGIAAGETETVTFNITADDGNGGVSAPVPLTITLQGMNDAPSDIRAISAGASVADSALVATYNGNDVPQQGVLVATLSTVDADDPAGSAMYTYSISGADRASFELRDAAGVASTSAGNGYLWLVSGNREPSEMWDITITTQDSGSEMIAQPFTITRDGVATPVITGGDMEGVITDTDAADHENVPASDSGMITATGGDITWQSSVPSITGTSLAAADFVNMLRLTPSNDGNSVNWEFVPTDAINDLNTADDVTITYTITAMNAAGATTTTLMIDINGVNNAVPEIVVDSQFTARTIADANDISTNVPAALTDGVFTARGTVTGWSHTGPVISDANHASTDFGNFRFTDATNSGAWNFTPTAAINQLDAGQTVDLVYTITATNAAGASNTQEFTITLEGADDVPVITSEDIDFNPSSRVMDPDRAQDDDNPTADDPFTGMFTATDVDGDAITWMATATGARSTYGRVDFSSTTNGMWTFTLLDPGITALNNLTPGEEQEVTFDITASDGSNTVTDTRPLTITLRGAAAAGNNNDPEITAGAGSDFARTITINNPNDLSTDGRFRATDADGDTTFTWRVSGDTDRGVFTVDNTAGSTNGDWSFTLTADQFAGYGDTPVPLTFTITADDGSRLSDPETLTIMIDGANDASVLALNTPAGTAITADDDSTNNVISGTLTNTDPDTGQSGFGGTTGNTLQGRTGGSGVFETDGTIAGQYGSLRLDSAAGTWSYTLNDADATFSGTQNDEFQIQVRNVDGGSEETSNTVTLTIAVTGSGADDPVNVVPRVDAITPVVIDSRGDTASGTFRVTDPDDSAHTWSTTSALSGTYGTFEITDTATGAWEFRLDQAAFNALAGSGAGSEVTLSFDIIATENDGDGAASAPETLTITLRGVNDASVLALNTPDGTDITADSDSTNNEISGTLTNTDPDTGQSGFGGTTGNTLQGRMGESGVFETDGSIAGRYGSLSLDSDAGTWSYTLNDAAATFSGLRNDVFQIQVRNVDGGSGDTSNTVTLTIAVTGSGAGAPVNVVPSVDTITPVVIDSRDDMTKTGDFSVTDPDNAAHTWSTESALSTLFGPYWTFVITNTATGEWIFALNQAAFDALGVSSEELTINIIATENDGDRAASAPETLTITITGMPGASVLALNTPDGTDITADSNPANNEISGTLTNTHSDIGQSGFGGTTGNTLQGRTGRSGVFETDGSIAGLYGVLTLDNATGRWSYMLNDADATFSGLRNDVFQIQVRNGGGGSEDTSNTVTLTIAVTGSGAGESVNVVPSVDSIAAVTIDSRDDIVTMGDFSVTDPDNSAHRWSTASTLFGPYGTFGITDTATGAWAFTLIQGAFDALAGSGAGHEVTLTFDIIATENDGDGAASAPETLTITLQGANDAPELRTSDGTTAISESVTAGSAPAVSGMLTNTDLDTGQSGFGGTTGNTVEGQSGTSGGFESDGSIAGLYGVLTLDNATGRWSYVLTDDAATFIGTQNEVFQIRVRNDDGTSEYSNIVTLTIAVMGSGTSTVDPGGGGGGGAPGNEAPRVNAIPAVTIDSRDEITTTGDFIVTDPDSAAHTWSATPPLLGTYGEFAFTNIATGAWVFTLRQAAFDALPGTGAGREQILTFDIIANDGNVNSAPETLRITLRGVNDAPVLTAPDDSMAIARTLTADDNPANNEISGTLTNTDPDTGESGFSGTTGATGNTLEGRSGRVDEYGGTDGTAIMGLYGSLTLDSAAGTWSYVLNDNAASFSGTQQDVFQIRVQNNDGDSIQASDPLTLTILVTGSGTGEVLNFVPVVSTITPVVIDSRDDTASGRFIVTDLDDVVHEWSTISPQIGNYGTLVITDEVTGTWEFRLNQEEFDVLPGSGVGRQQIITFDIIADDDDAVSAPVPLTITLQGVNDAPVIDTTPEPADQARTPYSVINQRFEVSISDPNRSDDENDPTATGTFAVSDADGDPIRWTVVRLAANPADAGADNYGVVEFNNPDNPNEWTFTLNNTGVEALNALGSGASAHATFRITADDFRGSTDSQDLIITLVGADSHAPVLAVDGITPEADGAVVVTAEVVETSHGIPGTPTVSGSFAFTDNDQGQGGFTTDESPNMPIGGTIQHLIGDAFAHNFIDASYRDITLDGPTFISEQLVGTYGRLILSPDGTWTYELDNERTATQNLDDRESGLDTFSIRIKDGADPMLFSNAVVIRVSVKGSNDAPPATSPPQLLSNGASGAVIADVTESGHQAVDEVSVVFDGVDTATGAFTHIDADAGQGGFVGGTVQVNTADILGNPTGTYVFVDPSSSDTGVQLDGDYGTFFLNTDGTWRYDLDNTNSEVNALKENIPRADRFIVRIEDDAEPGLYSNIIPVTINILGKNDAPILTQVAGADLEVTEDDVNNDAASGSFINTDVDTGETGYGSTTGNTLQGRRMPGSEEDINYADGSNTANRAPNAPVGASPEEAGRGTAIAGVYGTLYLKNDGTWSYELVNARAQALTSADAGANAASDVFQVRVENISGSTVYSNVETITIRVTGMDEPAASPEANAPVLMSSDLTTEVARTLTESGHQVMGSPPVTVASHGVSIASGSFTHTDDDAGQGNFVGGRVQITTADAQGNPVRDYVDGVSAGNRIGGEDRGTMLAGDYGTIYLRADGGWYYVLDNRNSAVDVLSAGDSLTDRFLVRIQDTAEPTLFSGAIPINIAITGANDAPILTSIAPATINAVGTTVGLLNVRDPDMNNIITWRSARGEGEIDIGTFSIGSDNRWSFTLTQDEFDSLGDDPVTLTFDIIASDGVADSLVQPLTLTLDGINDAPVITSAFATVTDRVTTGMFVGSDPDIGDNITRWSLAPLPADFAREYGTFLINPTTGAWTFTLSSVRAAALRALGDTGTPSPVTIRITAEDSDSGTTTEDFQLVFDGRNDAPVLTLASPVSPLRLTDGAGVKIIQGSLTNADPDTGQSGFIFPGNTLQGRHISDIDEQTGDPVFMDAADIGVLFQGTYGTLLLFSSGNWRYDLIDRDGSAVDMLRGGARVQDVFELQVVNADRDSTVTSDLFMLEIEITGENDVPEIDSSTFTTQTIREYPRSGAITGRFRAEDIDEGDPQIWRVVPSGSNNETFGVFDLDPDGAWSFRFTEEGVRRFGRLSEGERVHIDRRIEVRDAEGIGQGSSDVQDLRITLVGVGGFRPIILTAISTQSDFNRDDLIINERDGMLTGRFEADPRSTTFDWQVSSTPNRPDYINPTSGPGGFRGRFTISDLAADNGAWEFSLNGTGKSFFDTLGRGAESVFSYDITAFNPRGTPSVPVKIDITLRGVNDAPLIDTSNLDVAVTRRDVVERDGETLIEIDGRFIGTDIDRFADGSGDTLTWSLRDGIEINSGDDGGERIRAWQEFGTAVGDPDGEALAQLVSIHGTGEWRLTLTDAGVERLDRLSPGQGIEISFVVRLGDGLGGTDFETLTVTLQGTHDDPILLPTLLPHPDDVGAVEHDTFVQRGGDTTAAGQVGFRSGDQFASFAADNVTPTALYTDSIGDTISIVGNDDTANGGTGVWIQGTYGTLVLRSDGSWRYTLDQNDPDTRSLNSDNRVIDEFRLGYVVSTPNEDDRIETVSLNIDVRGLRGFTLQETIGAGDVYYHIPASGGQITGLRSDGSVSLPLDIINYRVGLTEADAIAASPATLTVIDRGIPGDDTSNVGRFELDAATGSWAYSIIDHEYLDSLIDATVDNPEGRFISGERATRTIWIAADAFDTSDLNGSRSPITLALEIDLAGMTDVSVPAGGRHLGTDDDEIIIAGDGVETIITGAGKNAIYARAGNDVITLDDAAGEDVVYYRFNSADDTGNQNIWESRDGSDTINDFRMGQDTFIFVDLDEDGPVASLQDILLAPNPEALSFSLHAMIETTENTPGSGVFTDTLTGFLLRFNGDSAGQMITINYHTSSHVVLTEANRANYGIDALSSNQEASTQHEITETSIYDNYFGGDGHFQVIGGLPEILTEIRTTNEETLSGNNMDPVITPSTLSAIVTADGATGTLAATDDRTIAEMITWTVDLNPTGPNNYGMLELISGNHGEWTLTLNQAGLDALEDLGHEDTVDVAFRVTADDGQGGSTTETLTIMLEGANDAPTLALAVTGDNNVREDSGDLMVTGTLTNTDPDTGQSGFASGGNVNADVTNTVQARRMPASDEVVDFVSGSDTDNGGEGTKIRGVYGDLYLKNDGTWTYELVNRRDATQLLNAGDRENDVFEIRVENVDGTTAYSGNTEHSNVVTLTIQVRGEFDSPAQGNPPVLTEITASKALTESGHDFDGSVNAGSHIASGSFEHTDPQPGQGGFIGGTVQVTTADDQGNPRLDYVDGVNTGNRIEGVDRGTMLVGDYGTIYLRADGGWYYVLGNTNPATDALNASIIVTDRFLVRIQDDDDPTLFSDVIPINITITGENDAPVIDTDSSTSVFEATINAVGTINDVVVANDPDMGDTITWTWDRRGLDIGTFDIVTSGAGGNGTWSFTLTPEEFLSLPGAPVTVEFDIIVRDGDVNSEMQTLTLTLEGVNESPVITSTSTTVTEPVTTGRFVVEDPDIGDSIASWSIVPLSDNFLRDYGDFKVTNVDPVTGEPLLGAWTFTLSDSRAATLAALDGAGTPPPVTIRITAEDSYGSTTTEDFEFAFESRSDVPVLTLAVPGDNMVTEDSADLRVTGTLTNVDLDRGQSGFVYTGNTVQGRHVPATGTTNFVDGSNTVNLRASIPDGTQIMGTYGALYLKNDGNWEYVLDNSLDATQRLLEAATAQDVFELQVVNVDGGGTETSNPVMLEIEVTGADDGLIFDASTFQEVVVTDFPLSLVLRGRFIADNRDEADGPQIWRRVINEKYPRDVHEHTYGNFTLEPDGAWEFRFTQQGIRQFGLLPEGQFRWIDTVIEVREEGERDVSNLRGFRITINGSEEAAGLTHIDTFQGSDFHRDDLIINGRDDMVTGQFAALKVTREGPVDFLPDDWVVRSTSSSPSYTNPTSGPGGFRGRFTINDAQTSDNGEWTFSLNETGKTFYDTLREGAESVFSYDIVANDNGNPSYPRTIEITLVGVNDPHKIDTSTLAVTATRQNIVQDFGSYVQRRIGVDDVDVGTNRYTFTAIEANYDAIPNPDYDPRREGDYAIQQFRHEQDPFRHDPPPSPIIEVPFGGIPIATRDSWTRLIFTDNLREGQTSNRGEYRLELTSAGRQLLNDLGASSESREVRYQITVRDSDGNEDIETLVVRLQGTYDDPHRTPRLLRHGSDASLDIEVQRGTDTTARGQIGFHTDERYARFELDDVNPAARHREETDLTIATRRTDGDNGGKGVAVTGIYGTLFLKADGSWTYELNDADPDTRLLTSADPAADVMDRFRLGYQVDIETSEDLARAVDADIRVRGLLTTTVAEIEPGSDAYYHTLAAGQIGGMFGGVVQTLYNIRVAFTEADAIATGTTSLIDMENPDDPTSTIGRFEIDAATGDWTYIITDHEYLDSLITGGLFGSGEETTRTFWIAADVNPSPAVDPVTIRYELSIDIKGMDYFSVADGGSHTGTAAHEIIVGGSRIETISGGAGKNVIYARAGADVITLDATGEDVIYYGFESGNSLGNQNIWSGTDGPDTINDFTRGQDTFILVDFDTVDASKAEILDPLIPDSRPVSLHAMIDTTDPSNGGVFIDTLTGFQLRFNGDSAGQVITINYHTSSHVVITDANRASYGIDALSSTEEGSTQHEIVQTNIYDNYFGGGDRFQIVEDLPEVITKIRNTNNVPVVSISGCKLIGA